MLTELGCPLAQGYHFGRPGTAGEIDDLLLGQELVDVQRRSDLSVVPVIP